MAQVVHPVNGIITIYQTAFVSGSPLSLVEVALITRDGEPAQQPDPAWLQYETNTSVTPEGLNKLQVVYQIPRDLIGFGEYVVREVAGTPDGQVTPHLMTLRVGEIVEVEGGLGLPVIEAGDELKYVRAGTEGEAYELAQPSAAEVTFDDSVAGLGTDEVQATLEALDSRQGAHAADQANPHAVTAQQAGAAPAGHDHPEYLTETEHDALDAAAHASGAAADGQILTADGAGGAAWEDNAGGGVSDHGQLAGLSHDDHAQYALADGTRGDFAQVEHDHAWTEITGRPSEFPPAPHTHPISDLPVATSGEVNGAELVAADDVRLSDAREPEAHTHTESEITDLDKYDRAQVDAFLAGKADVGHTHDDRYYTETEADTLLAGKADEAHTHDLDELSDVDVPAPADGDALKYNAAAAQWQAAQLSSGGGDGVTDHGALTGLGDDDHLGYALADGTRGDFAPTEHDHGWTEITGRPSEFPPAPHTHDERYYTETETDGLLSGKAEAEHTHSQLHARAHSILSVADHDDVDGAAPGSGDVLTYDASTGQWSAKQPVAGDGGVSDHGQLTGLGDDDHTQYALADGTRGDFAAPGHQHDGRYYTETETNSLLDDKADAAHAHAEYLTEAEHATLDADMHASGGAADGQVLTADGIGGAAWEDATGGGGVSDHGLLTGLGDDDHTQYALADGSRGDFAALAHTHTATEISFDPASTNLASTEIQAALAELDGEALRPDAPQLMTGFWEFESFIAVGDYSDGDNVFLNTKGVYLRHPGDSGNVNALLRPPGDGMVLLSDERFQLAVYYDGNSHAFIEGVPNDGAGPEGYIHAHVPIQFGFDGSRALARSGGDLTWDDQVVALASERIAANVGYDNTASGLAATEVQAALDELDAEAVRENTNPTFSALEVGDFFDDTGLYFTPGGIYIGDPSDEVLLPSLLRADAGDGLVMLSPQRLQLALHYDGNSHAQVEIFPLDEVDGPEALIQLWAPLQFGTGTDRRLTRSGDDLTWGGEVVALASERIAANVGYDGSASGSAAKDVQAAIDDIYLQLSGVGGSG